METQVYDGDALAASLSGCVNIDDSDEEGCSKPTPPAPALPSTALAGKTRKKAPAMVPACPDEDPAAPAKEPAGKGTAEFSAEVHAEVKNFLTEAYTHAYCSPCDFFGMHARAFMNVCVCVFVCMHAYYTVGMYGKPSCRRLF